MKICERLLAVTGVPTRIIYLDLIRQIVHSDLEEASRELDSPCRPLTRRAPAS